MADDKLYSRSEKPRQTQNSDFSRKPLCVFGVMNNANGVRIAAEMLTWLRMVYDVTIIEHDGSQFEYPALKAAQELSISTGQPVLYIHTRGAVNVWRTTIPTREMWKDQFCCQWKKYFDLTACREPRVLCPFVDDDGETRYNGFVANTAAWQMVDLKPSADRMVYERLWRGKGCVYGLLIHSTQNDIKKVRKYLYDNYE